MESHKNDRESPSRVPSLNCAVPGGAVRVIVW